jgi:hypothetical protein
MSRRVPEALIGAFTVLVLVAASVVPVAVASSSRPTVTLGTSVSETSAAVTVDINRGTQQVASCEYVLDDAAAGTCGAATAVDHKASRYTLELTGQTPGQHTVTVSIELKNHGTASAASTFTIDAAETDTDGDGIPDSTDNCPTIANPNQADNYGSPKGDACEDTDGDGILDVNEPDICVSVNGVVILTAGTAVCESIESTGSSPNIAVGDGDQTDAFAGNGDNNTATAIGAFAIARADQGNGDTATADGEGSVTFAGNGDGNTATATGAAASASADHGNGNTATADGQDAHAFAGPGNNNTAIADGDGTFARASAPTGCTVTNGVCP